MNRIHLSLPQSWNALTVPQLEAVARIFIDEARRYTLTGLFDHTSLLVQCFFALSGLRVTSLALSDLPTTNPDGHAQAEPDGSPSDPEAFHAEATSAPLPPLATPSTPPEHTYYHCEYADLVLRNQRQTVDGRVVPIRIYLNEIMALAVGEISDRDVRRYLKKLEHYTARIEAGKEADEPEPPEPQGPLSWLLKPCTLTLFPYPELTLPDVAPVPEASADGHRKPAPRYERWLNPKTLQPEVRPCPPTVTLAGPAEYLQDFSWQQYRISCDFMSYLQQCENALYREQKKAINNDQLTINNVARAGHSHPPLRVNERVRQLTEQVQDARAQWLANLFTRPVLYEDPDTRQLVYAPRYLPSQCTDNAYLFRDFPEEKFQVISFFWQGMMHHLSHEFPKVFRSNKVGTAADSDPFQLYTRSTTTMIKYAATNEEQVNHTTYTIILQHMQDMAEENDRIDAMKNNK